MGNIEVGHRGEWLHHDSNNDMKKKLQEVRKHAMGDLILVRKEQESGRLSLGKKLLALRFHG